MCDTLAILADSSADEAVLFAKNSDREPNEAMEVVYVPARSWSHQARLRCTYIDIPQVAHTAAVVLCKPFHMWGAEMGVNQYGLAIGNEAVFTKIPFKRRNDGLTGMDLLRLALERCCTAESAVNTITTLLERYGQDACGGYTNRNFFYHNSFLIADRKEVWLLETADRHWAASRITQGVVSISNGLTLGIHCDRLAKSTTAFARKKGWWNGTEPFHFARTFSDWFYTRMSRCRLRQRLTRRAADKRPVDLPALWAILRQHNLPDPAFHPARATTASICMHATGPWNPSSTTGSMVVALPPTGPPRIWVTATSYPCLSAFKPFRMGSAVLAHDAHWNRPGAQPDHSLWWQAECMARQLAICYPEWKPRIRAELDAIEREATQFDWTAPPKKQDLHSKQLVDKHFDIIHKWQSMLAKKSSQLWRYPLRHLWPAWQNRQLTRKAKSEHT